MVGDEAAYNQAGKEGIMDGRFDCCRYEPSLDELLADDVMTPVLRSAGLDAQGVGVRDEIGGPTTSRSRRGKLVNAPTIDRVAI